MRLTTVSLALALAAAAPGPEARGPTGHEPSRPSTEVVITSHQEGGLGFYDAATLALHGTLVLPAPSYRISVSADGRTVFVALADHAEGGCCSLTAIDLASRQACRMLDIADEGIPAPDGRWVFAQRGGSGISVFDGPTLARLPELRGPRQDVNYRLHPSPDGRRLFALIVWRGVSLDTFDLERGRFMRNQPVSGTSAAWLGERFYVIGSRDGRPTLQTMAGDGSSGEPADLEGDVVGLPAHPTLVPVGRRLLLYRVSAPWLIAGRRPDDRPWSTGLWAIDPATARVTGRLASGIELGDLAVTGDGRDLIAIQPAAAAEGAPSLVRLDAENGRERVRRLLPPGARRLAVAVVPKAFIPDGDVPVTDCRR